MTSKEKKKTLYVDDLTEKWKIIENNKVKNYKGKYIFISFPGHISICKMVQPNLKKGELYVNPIIEEVGKIPLLDGSIVDYIMPVKNYVYFHYVNNNKIYKYDMKTNRLT